MRRWTESSPRLRTWRRKAKYSRLIPFALIAHKRHPHHVGGAGRAERHAGDNDDALTGLGKTLLEGEAAGALHHVVLVVRVLGDHAVDAPNDRQLTARGDDR